jgi:Leucine-rich repeat (LRR) protein
MVTIPNNTTPATYFSEKKLQPHILTNPQEIAEAGPLATIEDVIRGSLVIQKLEQILPLLKKVTELVRKKGGQLYIKNFWDNPDLLGYAGVNIKIHMPLPKAGNWERINRYMLMELQIHTSEIMELQIQDSAIMGGMKACSEESVQRLYKMLGETTENIPLEVIDTSKLLHLIPITNLFHAMEEAIEREKPSTNKTPQLFQEITPETEVTIHAAIPADTVVNFSESGINENSTPENNELEQLSNYANSTSSSIAAIEPDSISDTGTEVTLQANEPDPVSKSKEGQIVEPKDKKAIATAWSGIAAKISKMLDLPTTNMEKEKKCLWVNTAQSVDELYDNAVQMAPYFKKMCKKAAKSQPDCSVNFGPENSMIKEITSLLAKIEKNTNTTNTQKISEAEYKEEVECKKEVECKEEIERKEEVECKEEIERNEEVERKKEVECKEEVERTVNVMTELLIIAKKPLDHITRLTSPDGLKSLDLSASQIADCDLECLKGFTALQRLDLTSCDLITDSCLESLGSLPGLQHLILSGCRLITGNGLEKLTTLKSLDLSKCALTDSGVESLRSLTGLESLNLSGCRSTDSQLARLRSLTALISLNLFECDITDVGLGSLRSFIVLQHLYLSIWRITDSGVARLRSLTKLISLNLVGSPNHSFKCTNILELLKNFTALQTLSFTYIQFTGQTLKDLKNLPALQNLSLSYCLQSSNTESLLSILGSLTTLQSLNLSHNHLYKPDEGWASLEPLIALKSLDLSRCNISDSVLENLQKLPGLRTLNLFGCEKVTDAAKKKMRRVQILNEEKKV